MYKRTAECEKKKKYRTEKRGIFTFLAKRIANIGARSNEELSASKPVNRVAHTHIQIHARKHTRMRARESKRIIIDFSAV